MVGTAGGDRTAFALLLTLHVLSAILGAVAIALGGIYGGTARHLERPGATEEARRWFARPNQAALVVLAVPFFGVGALVADGRSGQLGRAWVVLALCIWLAIAGLLTGVIRPAEEELGRMLAEPAEVTPPTGADPPLGAAPPPGADPPPAADRPAGPPGPSPTTLDAAAVAACGRRISLAAAACDLGFVVALGLMIWQP